MEEDLHIHGAVSTPYVSAPSSPGSGPPRSYGGGFFYSAPASPTHHVLSSSNSVLLAPLEGAGGSFEFEFTVRHEATGPAASGSMTSADELFLNGKIRPMKLSSHLQRPQDLAPLIDVLENDGEEEDKFDRGRDLKSRDRSKSLRRRTRSMSPLRTNTAFQWLEEFKDARESTEINEIKEKLEAEEDRQRANDDDNGTPSSGGSSRSSSVGRSSKRWVFLKELLYRSKSEGRNSSNSNRNHKLWSTLSFSPSSSSAQKDKKSSDSQTSKTADAVDGSGTTPKTKKAVNGLGMNRKRRVGRSAHEVHYTTKRAQAEEMRKKTYLPYRQGLLGCLGFSSKSYGAMNGFLNSVSSR
ncbi:uncharacterized protein LOC112502711 [Cynara cardunculus var. scolymus]|uniref:Calmodulin-binding protein n=1 Tax=Cynara cardunculus var. scolymus TaxID=59895 RepID=A0A103XC58_CYNCS|nr:uncharacterized protein LOC112502711 [Cynara cardunculus var. scolymus]KVH88013.1 Protein of unknown function DUF1645 [Cynara cardunculus var. scolymus]